MCCCSGNGGNAIAANGYGLVFQFAAIADVDDSDVANGSFNGVFCGGFFLRRIEANG
jgi:hypothetical protein